MFEKTKSFATSKTDYTAIQGRIKGGILHIQGSGDNVNRDYGVAVDFPVDPTIQAYLEQRPHTEKTLAGTDAMYFPLQYAIRGNYIHFQVRGNNFNRGYGAAFDVNADLLPDLVTFAD